MPMPRTCARPILALLAFGLGLSSGGCALVERLQGAGEEPAPISESPAGGPSQAPEAGSSELTAARARVSALETDVLNLQIELADRQARMEQLRRVQADQEKRLDEAFTEVARTKAQLGSGGSRTHAASTIAEVELALKELGEQPVPAAEEPRIKRVRQLLGMSSKELQAENPSGAFYLASKARDQMAIVTAAARSEDGASAGGSEAAFLVPLALRTTARSNLREQPGLDAKVLQVLDAGAPATGYAVLGSWIRVQVGEGVAGWVYRDLLTVR